MRPRAIGTISVAWLVLLAVAQTGSAGTEEEPEITDAADDQEAGGAVPVDPAGFAAADVRTAWIESETADAVVLAIRAGGDIVGGVAGGTPTTYYRFTFNLKVAGTAYSAGANVHYNAVAVPEGATSEAVVDGSAIRLTVPKANIGDPTMGVLMTELFVLTAVTAPPATATLVSDRAPDSGFGTDYTFTGGAGGAVDANDTDADGLNDTWEQDNFGNLSQNGTGDPDADNRTNAQEYASGTDPNAADTDADGLDDGEEFELGTNATNPDTDGDGETDGDEVANGTNPLDPNDPPADDGDGEGDGGGDGDGGDGTGDGDGADDGDGGGGDSDTLAENFQEDTGYAIASAAGMAAVVVLGILGLAVRWGA